MLLEPHQHASYVVSSMLKLMSVRVLGGFGASGMLYLPNAKPGHYIREHTTPDVTPRPALAPRDYVTFLLLFSRADVRYALSYVEGMTESVTGC